MSFDMPTSASHQFGDDLPKHNPWEEDRLDYAPIANQISKAIIGLSAPNGFVIGVNGKWGSGKSTLINFVSAFIEKHNSENATDVVTWIDYRPWIISGHQDLMVGFFKVLSERLGPRENWLIRVLKLVFRGASGTTDALVDAAANVAISIDPSGGLASRYSSTLAKKSINSLVARFIEEPSLQGSYEKLKVQLLKINKKIVVTIDDLDRLEFDELRSIMQMIKTVGKLPNIIYILVYDKDIVWNSLDERKANEPRYAEKIIQQEIDLPQPTKHALLSILDREISFIGKLVEESVRWHYAVSDGVRRWIKSPRDVLRFANALRFAWSALENEIDPVDLIVIEGLRIFDPQVFDWIRCKRDFFFSDGQFLFQPEHRMREAVAELDKSVSPQDINSIRRLIAILFPQSLKWFEGRGIIIGGEAYVELVNRRGIGSDTGFDTYFGMHLSPDQIAKAIVAELVSPEVSSEKAERIIRSYLVRWDRRDRSMSTRLFDELKGQFRISQSARPTNALLTALFQVGDDVIRLKERDAPFALSAQNQMSFLIESMLAAWGPDEGGPQLIEAFANGKSCAFLANIFVDRGREFEIFETPSNRPPLIYKPDFDRLGAILSEKICTSALSGNLEEAPLFFNILKSWAYLGYTQESRKWLSAGVMRDVVFCEKASRALVSYSVERKEKEYTMQDNPDPNIYDLRKFREAVQLHLETNNLSLDQRQLFEAVSQGCARHLGVEKSEP